MATAVLRCGHACSAILMPTPEYQCEHGTPKFPVTQHQQVKSSVAFEPNTR